MDRRLLGVIADEDALVRQACRTTTNKGGGDTKKPSHRSHLHLHKSPAGARTGVSDAFRRRGAANETDEDDEDELSETTSVTVSEAEPSTGTALPTTSSVGVTTTTSSRPSPPASPSRPTLIVEPDGGPSSAAYCPSCSPLASASAAAAAAAACHHLYPHLVKVPTSYYGGSGCYPALDPRNGLMEPHFGIPLQFPSAFATFHAPIPVDQRTHEGRYVWEPASSSSSSAAAAAAAAAIRMHSFHHGVSGSATSSPSLSEISAFVAASAPRAGARSPQPNDNHQEPSAESSSSSAVAAAAAAASATLHGPHHPSTHHPAFRINPYMEHLYSSFHSSPALSLRGFSPVDTRGLPLQPDYLSQMSAMSPRSGALEMHQAGVGGGHHHPPPSTIGGSTDLPPFSLESSRLTSPRPSLRQGRKRALSSSPYSDSFDINSMIRFSPNSLVSIMNGSRSSSCTSGSYGHLSAGTISPVLSVHPAAAAMPTSHMQQLQHLMRQGSLPGSPILFGHHHPHAHMQTPSAAAFGAQPHHLLVAQAHQQMHPQAALAHLHHLHHHHPHHFHPQHLHHHHHHQAYCESELGGGGAGVGSKLEPMGGGESVATCNKERCAPSTNNNNNNNISNNNNSNSSNNNNLVSSTVEQVVAPEPVKRTPRIKKEPMVSLGCSYASSASVSVIDDKDSSNDPMKDEPGDFIETNCHWRDCRLEFNTQDELVKHINNEHIHANKKLFVCRWTECSREEKPFKAQYMLVVHVRQHTGEKPNRCTFEGCSKAYSRLENLKTHLRSHTGEKPYMCEFPGCTKAFSNASDRAKHQNRTHSNEKPYVCKAPGCTKRYTDPSSLRKHVKTVHGADFFANKKHKGAGSDGGGLGHGSPGRDDDKDEGRSPKSGEDCPGSNKAVSLSSPSIKSEESNSPGGQPSPGVDSNAMIGAGGNFRSSCLIDDPISDNNVSTTNGYEDIAEESSEWDVKEPDEIEVPELVSVLVSSSERANDNGSRNQRNQFRNRMYAKGLVGLPSMLQLPSIGGGGGGDLPPPGSNRRIGGGGVGGNAGQTTFNGNSQTRNLIDLKASLGQRKLIDLNLNTNSSPRQNNVLNYMVRRRDSNTSTISSFYSSVRSENSPHPPLLPGIGNGSRRGSEASQVSQMSQGGGGGGVGVNGGRIASSPFVDFISPGSSRRSSESMLNLQGITASMAAHLQRLHRRALANQDQLLGAGSQNLEVQPQSMSTSSGHINSHGWGAAASRDIGSGGGGGGQAAAGRQTSLSCRTPLPHEVPNRDVRRASDPVRPMDRHFGVERRLNRHHSLRIPLPPISASHSQASGTHVANGGGDDDEEDDDDDDDDKLRHPNGEVALDECEEDQMVEENKNLVIPDEMVKYLNQVAERARLEREQNPQDESISRPVSAIGAAKPPPHTVPLNRQSSSSTTTTTAYVVPSSVTVPHQLNQCVTDSPSPMAPQNSLATGQSRAAAMWSHQAQQPFSPEYGGQPNANINMAMSNMNLNTAAIGRAGGGGGGLPIGSSSAGFLMGITTSAGQSSGGDRRPENNHVCIGCQQTAPSCNKLIDASSANNEYAGGLAISNQNNVPEIQQKLAYQQVPGNVVILEQNLGASCAHGYMVQMPPSVQPARSSNFQVVPQSFLVTRCQNCNATTMASSAAPSAIQKPPEIQCQDISQSTHQSKVAAAAAAAAVVVGGGGGTVPASHQVQSRGVGINGIDRNPSDSIQGMRPDVYQRTLEYVKQCQTWTVAATPSSDPNVGVVASAAVKNRTSAPGTVAVSTGAMIAGGMGSMEMSPGCNKVTSTTADGQQEFSGINTAADLHQDCNAGAQVRQQQQQQPCRLQQQPPPPSPSLIGTRNSSRLTTLYEGKMSGPLSLLETSNMVINDLNSTLTSLAEESRFLQMIQ